MSKRKIKEEQYKEFKKCAFCDDIISKKYSGIKDRLYTTTKTFSVVECEKCKAGFINPMPVGDVSRYYPTNYLSGEQDDKTEPNKSLDLERWYRYNQYKYDFKLLKRATGLDIKNANSYVDIGCGSGERVTFVSERGCENASGVDKFDFAKSKSKSEVKLINSEVLNFRPSKKIQVASLFHVLEHVENPKEILLHIKTAILAENGKIIIQVPNYGSIERRFFGHRWFGLDVPRHVWQFNERALLKMVSEAGLKVEGLYQLNAPLHPVTVVPSIFRDLDIQRIWVSQEHGIFYKRTMTILWAVLTALTIPLNIFQNIIGKSSMLTIVASKE